MFLRYTTPLFCLLALTLLAVPITAQDAEDDLYWQNFDERYPEIAGKGQELWDKAAEIAELQVGEADEDAFATRQNLIFQALAVNERDRAIMRKKAKTKAEHDWILSRRDAVRQFDADVKAIKALRAKADDELTQQDMTELLQTSVSLMSYIYEAQIQANESYFESVVEENLSLQEQIEAPENEPEPEVEPETETESPPPSGTSRRAKKGDFRAYLQPNRIKINSDRNRNQYNRNHVQITGAIRNQTDRPARFQFQVLGQRADGRVVGLKTITTGVVQPGGVREIDTRMPVEHSAYVRRVDMREVFVIEP